MSHYSKRIKYPYAFPIYQTHKKLREYNAFDIRKSREIRKKFADFVKKTKDWIALGSLKKAVEHYNYKKPHRSLTNGKLRTPYQAFLEKKKKEK